MPPSIDSASLRLRLQSVKDAVQRKMMPPDCDPVLMRESLEKMEDFLNKGQLRPLQQRLQRMESLLHYDANASPSEPADKDSLSARLKRANDWVDRRGTPPDCDAISIRGYLQQLKYLLDNNGDYRTLQIRLQRLETLIQIRPSQVKPKPQPQPPPPPPVTGEEEEEWFDPNDSRKEELTKVKQAVKSLEASITKKLLNSSLNNPLYDVKDDMYALAKILLEFEKLPNHPPEDIITRALRNGTRFQPQQEVERVGKDHAVAKVKPNPPKRDIVTKTIDRVTEIVVRLYHPKKIELNGALLGNYAPVRTETTPSQEVKVEKGRIPENLNGMIIRNGPNPVFDPIGHYKWLDGDSMVHAISFKDGKATYVSHYVKTSRYKQEQYFGKSQFLQYGDLHGEFGLFMACMQLAKEVFGVLDMSYGWANANTGVVNHNETLMILQDWDNPYVLTTLDENGKLDTLGINDYNKKLLHSFTPHPKKDSITGELYILGSSYTPPYANFTIVTEHGDVSDPIEIDVRGPTYNHDFGLTEHYAIFMDLPYCFNPKKMLEQGTWIYSFDKKPSRFGVRDRYAKNKDEIIWFDFDETFFIFHIGNCWEEDEDNIVMICCVLEPEIKKVDEEKTKEVAESKNPANRKDNPFSALAQDASNNFYEISFKPPHVFAGRNENETFSESYLYKFILNKKTQVGHKYKISPTHFEYPKVNENYIGRKTKYMYLSEMNKEFKIPSIVKFDLEWETEIKLHFGGSEFGSEVAFVPTQFGTPLEEDDGYLTTFVHDEQKSISFAYVISAQRMEFVAKIKLPNKIPYGFHATFVPKEKFPEIKDDTSENN